MRYLVIIGALMNLFGCSVYIADTVKGKTKPNRMTWLLWSLAPLIATGAAISEGVTWAVLPVFMSGFCPFLIFLSTFFNKQSFWRLGKLDYVCGSLSLLALLVWWLSSQAAVAIVFAILSDGLAALPTIIKAWKYPESESGAAYIAAFFSAASSLFAVERWTFVELAFPVYLMTVISSILAGVYRRKIPAVKAFNP